MQNHMHLLPQRRFNGGRMKQNQRIPRARMRTLQLNKEAIVFDGCSVADGRCRVQPDSPQFPARLQALEEIDVAAGEKERSVVRRRSRAPASIHSGSGADASSAMG